MSYTREQIEAAMRDAAECGPTQAAMLRQLLAENDALREDAERFRALIDGEGWDMLNFSLVYTSEVDIRTTLRGDKARKAIDADRAKGGTA